MTTEKQDIRSLSMDARKEIRRTVFRLLEQGWRAPEITRELGYSLGTVQRWRRIYEQEGQKGLQEKPRGGSRIKPPHLSPEQEEAIQKDLIDKTPDQYKMKFCLWNSRAIRDHIKKAYGVPLADRTIRHYMQRWGFSPQRPVKRAIQQDKEEVRHWMETKYPAIKRKAQQEKAEIYWGDETGVSNQESNARGYSPIGQPPVLKNNGSKRIRLNMISAINNQGKLRFMIYRESMSPDLFIGFMKRLVRDANHKVYLIVDNLKTHHSKRVTQWVEANSEKIRLYYLPRYSPQLNPDEYLNNDLKQGLSQREISFDEKHMEGKIRSHMMKNQKNRPKIQRFFHHPEVRYAS